MQSYPVKENLIGSLVSEILRYKHTEKQSEILLLYHKDYKDDYVLNESDVLLLIQSQLYPL